MQLLTSTRSMHSRPCFVGSVTFLPLVRIKHEVYSSCSKPHLAARQRCKAMSPGEMVLVTGSATLMAATLATCLLDNHMANHPTDVRMQRETTSLHGSLPAWSLYLPALNWAVFLSKAWAAAQPGAGGSGAVAPLHFACAVFYGTHSLG